MNATTVSKSARCALLAMAFSAGQFTPMVAYSQQKVIQKEPQIEVSNDQGNPLRVDGSINVNNEVEVKNSQGEALDVRGTVIVGNNQSIDVIERFPNTAYTVNRSLVAQNNSFDHSNENEFTVPVASNLRGITISWSSNLSLKLSKVCVLELRYPVDELERPVEQSSPTILKLPMPPNPGTVHIPLYEMFVGENVQLLLRLTQIPVFGEDQDTGCEVFATLHLQPLPGGILPLGPQFAPAGLGATAQR